jgi:spectinomycin phosphotransferase
VRERPPGVADADVLAAVRRSWAAEVNTVEHLPVGFGAHHWAAYDAAGAPLLFVTLDRLGSKRTADRLEAAYAGAAALSAAGLAFVLPSLPDAEGRFTRPFAGGALSCTPWRDGTPGGDLDVPWTADALRRLHATPPPTGLPPWQPLVDRGLADELARLTGREWGPGPFADPARHAVRDHLDDLARWAARYYHLGDLARGRRDTWVATHGEPDEGNQLLTSAGRLLVDWESLKLAPAELDLRILVDAGEAPEDVGADPAVLELFDLEWRLDEVSQYADWFAAPHTGNADDEIALDDLLHELTRP